VYDGVGHFSGESMTPQIVALSLCGSCNLECWFCRVGASLRHVERAVMTPELVQKILPLFPDAKLYRLGAQCEPTLNPHVAEIMNLIVDAGKRLHLTTNGTRLVDLSAGKFGQEVPWRELASVNVSLNEGSPEDYEALTGKPLFDKAVRGIEKVVKAGARTIVSFVMHKRNFHKAVDYVRFAKQLGAKKVNLLLYIEPFNYDTDAPVTMKEFALDQRAAVAKLLEQKQELSALGVELAWPKVADPARPLSGGCLQAQRRLDIDGAGDVALCCGGRGPRPEMGNVLELGAAVYNTGPMAELRSRILGPPADRPEKCQICRHNYEPFVGGGLCLIGSRSHSASGSPSVLPSSQ
jgi:MoaA/NifB/PqqE/SkfB family radical SAM enzyme